MPIVNPIIQVSGGASRTTAKLMKTGQAVSFATGDDGDLEDGRNVNFFTLAENNPFGNTYRFTDELGGQTYSNDIVIDWSTYDGSTVLGWHRIPYNLDGVLGNKTWYNHIANSNALSIITFTSGWKMPNIIELGSINYHNSASPFNYPPFNISTTYTTRIASSSESKYTTGWFKFISPIDGTCSAYPFNAISPFIASLSCRYFTVTGTTLT